MANQNVVIPDAKTGLNAAGPLFKPAVQKPPPVPGTLVAICRRKHLQNLEINGNARINSWVESMKASSPTHIKSTLPLSEDHSTWMNRHPSALEMFEQVMNECKGKKIVMFLDYDGTLSPIVSDPDRAFMDNKMRQAVRKLARYFPTAIVTGRCRDKVHDFVRLAELYYAGSHGMDIRGPSKGCKHTKGGQDILFQPASEFLPMIDEVYNILLQKTEPTPGAKVENNKFCVSVHFRCVEEKKWVELAQEVKSVIKKYPKLRMTQGRMVFEIRPMIKWDKGKALEFLLESLGYENCTDVLPIYIGDDKTDEDAFKVLKERGQGYGILVSKIPKDTNASYSLREPSEVMVFLQKLVGWKRRSLRAQFRMEKQLEEMKVSMPG